VKSPEADITSQVFLSNNQFSPETKNAIPYTLSKKFDSLQPALVELKRTDTIGRRIETPRKTDGKRHV
jgi:hypothetical protein